MYHEVSNIPSSEIQNYYNTQTSFCIHPDDFERQIVALIEAGYKIISLDDLESLDRSKDPTKLILLSFDDGFIGNFNFVLPLLRKYQLKAIFFLIVERIGKHPYMQWDNVRELVAAGMQIGSHGFSHQVIVGKEKEFFQKELFDSKKIIENQISQTVHSISFPHGAYDSSALQFVEKAGYRYVFTSDYGFSLKTRGNLLMMPRVNISREIAVEDIEILIAPSHFYYCQKMMKDLLGKSIKKVIGHRNYLHLYTKLHGLSE